MFKIISIEKITREFKQTIVINGYKLNSRNFALINCSINGQVFTGEISPLPGLSDETLDQILHFVQNKINEEYKINNEINLKKSFFNQIEFSEKFKSLIFAIESCFLQYYLKNNLITWSTKKVISNTFLLNSNFSSINTQSLKLKVGRENIDNEIQKINNIVNRNTSIKLRLDGNQLLTIDAVKKFYDCFHKNIEYFEEPFKNFLDYKNLIYPIALDENVSSFLVSPIKFNIKALVIKPILFNGLSEVFNIIDNSPVPCVISSAYQGPIGLQILYNLASYQNKKNEIEHGLDTEKYFK